MLIVRNPKIPIEAQGTINRLKMDANSMTVRDNIKKGGYFILHDIAYKALTAIIKGTEAVPGKNCIKANLDEMMGGN